MMGLVLISFTRFAMLVFFYGRESDDLIKEEEFILIFMKIAYLS